MAISVVLISGIKIYKMQMLLKLFNIMYLYRIWQHRREKGHSTGTEEFI